MSESFCALFLLLPTNAFVVVVDDDDDDAI